MQEFEYQKTSIRTVGLSEHYPISNARTFKNADGKDILQMPLSPEQTLAIQKMEANSIFRLVSTGVDADNRIRSGTSVQIQHVDSKHFLVENKAKFTVKREEGDSKSEKTSFSRAKSVRAKDKGEYEEMNASQIRKASQMEKKQTSMLLRM